MNDAAPESAAAPERAEAEKIFAAEKRLAGLRLLVLASGTVTFPLLTKVPGTIPWLAYDLLTLAWFYGLYVYVREPFRRYPLLLSSYFTTALDALFSMAWIYATGGFHSPFYVVVYPAVVSVAFRFQTRQAAVASLLYAGSYVALLAVLGQLGTHAAEALVRIMYIFLTAALGAAISREVLAQTADKVRLEERIRTDEDRARLANAVEARAVAEEAVKARDEFLSMASHELRTPLTAMQLLVDSVVAGKGGAKIEQEADRLRGRLLRMQEQTERLVRLVDRLLDVTRIAAGRLLIEPADLNLSQFLDDVIDRWREPLERASCPVVARIAPGVRGHWDATRLEQVVANLLSNAMKYGAGRPIEVVLEASGGRARLAVRDQGIGIAAADQARIFDRFERAVSRTHFGGLGLGLWIASRIVAAMGGSIAVTSEVGQGSTFIVDLPRTAQATAVEQMSAPS